MSIHKSIAGDTEKDQLRYVELLRVSEPAPEDVTEMRDLMTRLNKSSEQVKIDASVIRRVDANKANIKPGLTPALNASRTAVEEFDQATREQIESVKARHSRELEELQANRAAEREAGSVAAFNEAHAVHRRAAESIQALNQLKSANPELLKAELVRSPIELD